MFVVIGTTTVDLIISGIDQMPRFDGDEFTANSLAWCSRPLTMSLGGNGANSAYVLATLGAQVALISAAGHDYMGERVTTWLTEKGVDLRGFVRRDTHGTATTTALITDQHNRLSFYYPGYQHEMAYDDLPRDIFVGVSALLITGYALLPGLRPAGYAAALRTAREQGAITALDIGPALGTPVTLHEIRPLLPFVDFLMANSGELSKCVGVDEMTICADRLLETGVGAVVVKRGADGSTIYRANEAPIEVAGFPVEADNTIGAGDTFNASFLFTQREGMPLTDALRFANAAASLVISGGDIVRGAPTRAQVEQFLRERP